MINLSYNLNVNSKIALNFFRDLLLKRFAPARISHTHHLFRQPVRFLLTFVIGFANLQRRLDR